VPPPVGTKVLAIVHVKPFTEPCDRCQMSSEQGLLATTPVLNGSLMWGRPRGHRADMKKRITAAVLWFFTGWFVGAATAFVLGMSGLLAPVLAIAFAAVVAGDPARLIWTPAAPRVSRVQRVQNPA
jgi:hypothetical protein